MENKLLKTVPEFYLDLPLLTTNQLAGLHTDFKVINTHTCASMTTFTFKKFKLYNQGLCFVNINAA